MGFLLKLVAFVGHVAVGGAVAALLLAGYWLPANDTPMDSDAIVVLGGSYTRASYAADLYKKGFAPVIYVSRIYRTRGEQVADKLAAGLPREEEISRRILEIKGVPAGAIRMFGENCLSTYEEAEALQNLGPELKTILVVTSPYHTRRAGLIFRRFMPDREIRMLSTPYDLYPKLWWRDKDAAKDTVLEMCKLSYYLLGGRFLGKAGSLKPVPAKVKESPTKT